MAFNTSEFTRLPELTRPPLQRWQKMPTRPKTPGCSVPSSPLRVRTTNSVLASSLKTPMSERRSKSQPSSPKCTRKTPVRSKTPKQSNSKTPVSGKKTPTACCRFIPGRSAAVEEYSCFMMLRRKELYEAEDSEEEEEGEAEVSTSPPREEFQRALLAAACNGEPPSGVLSFTASTPTAGQGSFLNYTNNSSLGSARLSTGVSFGSQKQEKRKVPKSEEKILDAPALVDDYYINVLDWGRNNLLAVALGPSIFLWNSQDGSVTQLLELTEEGSYITALSWAQKGKYLAVGVNDGSIQLWDVEKEKKVRTMRGHSDRVGCLHWNSHTLASGSKSGEVHMHDVRKPSHCVGVGQFHHLEVCGVKWSPDGRTLATGGNDNIVCVWNPRMSALDKPAQVLTGHQAAVKALAWCPWQSNLLATGGGSADRCIKFWNVSTGECQQSLDTKSQVSSLLWSRDGREILSSHGPPRNQLTIWRYPNLTKVADLKGHRGRVLHIAMSPRKSRVASAGADETLRVWKCFDAPSSSQNSSQHEHSLSSMMLSSVY